MNKRNARNVDIMTRHISLQLVTPSRLSCVGMRSLVSAVARKGRRRLAIVSCLCVEGEAGGKFAVEAGVRVLAGRCNSLKKIWSKNSQSGVVFGMWLFRLKVTNRIGDSFQRRNIGPCRKVLSFYSHKWGAGSEEDGDAVPNKHFYMYPLLILTCNG